MGDKLLNKIKISHFYAIFSLYNFYLQPVRSAFNVQDKHVKFISDKRLEPPSSISDLKTVVCVQDIPASLEIQLNQRTGSGIDQKCRSESHLSGEQAQTVEPSSSCPKELTKTTPEFQALSIERLPHCTLSQFTLYILMNRNVFPDGMYVYHKCVSSVHGNQKSVIDSLKFE